MPLFLLIGICIDPFLILHVRLTLSSCLNDHMSVTSLGKLTECAQTVLHAQALMLVKCQKESGMKAA